MAFMRQGWWGCGGWRWLVAIALLVVLTGCTIPQVKAEQRLFLNLSLEFLDAYEVPKQLVEGVPLGGLSAIQYDRARDRIYLLTDDRSNYAPARFYTAQLMVDGRDPAAPQIDRLVIDGSTTLMNREGQPFSPGSLDPEGLVISPRGTVLISSEGDRDQQIAPFIDEFDRQTGEWKGRLPIPQRYLPQTEPPSGVQTNLGFEALTLNAGGSVTPNSAYLEPFRVFAATESALVQDLNSSPESGSAEPEPTPIRILHYLVGDDLPTLLSEHLYRLEPDPEGAIANGLTELVSLDQGGHFLSLERTFGTAGAGAKIFQLAMGGATDISGVTSLVGDLTGLQPVRKQLLLDLSELGIYLDNLEGMTLGPRLPDGSQSLVLLSDDNFSDAQVTQILLFRLRSR